VGGWAKASSILFSKFFIAFGVFFYFFVDKPGEGFDGEVVESCAFLVKCEFLWYRVRVGFGLSGVSLPPPCGEG
jgi:hypothetical protein